MPRRHFGSLLSEPRISLMVAPWATLRGWGCCRWLGLAWCQPTVKGVGRVSMMRADLMKVWMMGRM